MRDSEAASGHRGGTIGATNKDYSAPTGSIRGGSLGKKNKHWDLGRGSGGGTDRAHPAVQENDPKKDGTPLPRTEEPIPRVELEPVRTEQATELPAQQVIPAGQDTIRPVIQEPVI